MMQIVHFQLLSIMGALFPVLARAKAVERGQRPCFEYKFVSSEQEKLLCMLD